MAAPGIRALGCRREAKPRVHGAAVRHNRASRGPAGLWQTQSAVSVQAYRKLAYAALKEVFSPQELF